MTTITNPERLGIIRQKILNQQASDEETKEYMLGMYKNSNITKEQYEKYLAKKDNEILNLALTIGASVLLGILLSKLFEE